LHFDLHFKSHLLGNGLYVCIHMYIYTYVYINIFIYKYIHICISISSMFSIYITAMRLSLKGFQLYRQFLSSCVYVYTYTHTCICIYIYMYIYIHVYIYIYTYIYMCIRILSIFSIYITAMRLFLKGSQLYLTIEL